METKYEIPEITESQRETLIAYCISRIEQSAEYSRAGLALRFALAKIGEGKCIWRYDESDYYWSGSCGEDWCFTDGGPEENRVRFCQGCGRPVVLEQPTNQNGEE